MKSIVFILTLLLIGVYANVFSQTNMQMVSVSLPEVAMLDVEGSDVTLEFGRPTNAGAPIVTPTNNAKWLNYTSAVAAGSTRSVAVSISQTIPGLDIKLQPVAALGGNGTLGTPALPVTLSTNPQTIISGIGGGYTGNGTGNGHQLLFSAVPNNYADITASVHTLSVIYTISDDGAFPSEIVPVTVNNVPNSVTIPTITEAGNDYGMPTPNGNPIILNYTFDNDMLSSPGADLFESGSIKVKMQYDPTTTWDPSLHLYAQRNGGSASLAAASYSGGFPYVEIPGATSVPFFDLIWNDQSTEPGTTVTYSDIPVSIQLSGVSVLIPAATYSAQILFVAEK